MAARTGSEYIEKLNTFVFVLELLIQIEMNQDGNLATT